MEKIQLTEKQKELLEAYGVIQEQFGLSPASARVNALLTVIDQEELTFDEIRKILSLSKSATSNAINNLLTINYIGYRTKLGERKRYFFSRMDQWQDSFRKNLDGFREYNKVMKAILAERTPKTKDYNTKVKELTQFIDYYSEEAKKIIDNWEKK
ncbi:MarR family transcriptional regulator [uncultured Marixanthomonas sp.]|uniref:GbsR/MarR family transcriptional regulator n=1 Tax=uncultured Marixanthomonas sp. TaxID=757245 RepID=UPI0030DDBE3C|tara:strand:+ start:46614 stop:47078 length:465 start_codon:yes stop_codon:yes gene_type:complete